MGGGCISLAARYRAINRCRAALRFSISTNSPLTTPEGAIYRSAFTASGGVPPYTWTWTVTGSDPAITYDAVSSITGTDHITVAVRYRPARYRWDYGDGAVVDTGSLGRAYPSISDVQHAYQQGSLSQPGQQYTYQLTADWSGDWFVSGDATGTGALGPRQSIYAAGQVMREVDQLRCPEAGCR